MQELQQLHDDAYLQQLVETTEAAIRKVDEQYAAKIADEQRQQRELLKQQELEAEQLETKQRAEELELIQREREELEARIAQQKLKAEYGRDMATINSLLAPFLDDAITQPSRTNPISKGGPRKPTSLDALRSSGALAETDDGLEFLFKVGGHPANMRKKGSFPSFISPRPLQKGSEQALVQRAQQLLIKYGELLVADRKLSP
jgi:hypothetical protein